LAGRPCSQATCQLGGPPRLIQ